jgi:cytoskeletal protein CcmA (bactofilin family)
MRKAGRWPWFLLVPVGILLISAAFALTTGTIFPPAAQATQAASVGECTQAARSPSFGGTVVVDAGEVLCGDLMVFGGTVIIHGQLRGNLLVFGGTISIDGGVSGDITLFGGSVTLLPGAHVHGSIHLYGGQQIRQHGALLDGTVDDHSQHSLFFGFQGPGFSVWYLIFMIPLSLLWVRFFPVHTTFIRVTVEQHVRRSFLVGLLTCLLAPVALFILFALIIAIPVALAVLIGLLLAWISGMVAISWSIGEQIMHALTSRPLGGKSRYLTVTLGQIALAIFCSLPVVGWFVGLGAGMVGLGAVLLSRFGTRIYGRPKQLLTL